MGLKNASQQIQQMVDEVFGPVNNVAVAYIDETLFGTQAQEGCEIWRNMKMMFGG